MREVPPHVDSRKDDGRTKLQCVRSRQRVGGATMCTATMGAACKNNINAAAFASQRGLAACRRTRAPSPSLACMTCAAMRTVGWSSQARTTVSHRLAHLAACAPATNARQSESATADRQEHSRFGGQQQT